MAEEFFPAVLEGQPIGVPGGETGQAYRARVDAVFAEIAEAHPGGGEVLVVSHGVTIATYLYVAGWTTPGGLPNASISVVTVTRPEGPRVVAVGLESLPD